jgi:hypothetical protein
MAADNEGSASWIDRQQRLLQLARCQLFFVGGAPRSGTTWLQSLLDSHPEVSCHGEGLFLKHLASPIEALLASRTKALDDKNRTVFRHGGGYPLPGPDDAAHLLGTAILLALERQIGGKMVRAVGEKTPENVFFFDRLKRVFPTAKFIGIARDPRDVLTSAWHFFHCRTESGDDTAAKTAFIRSALPSIDKGARAMLDLAGRYAADCYIVTYETMHAAPGSTAERLFRFLRVSDASNLVSDCVARTSFAAATAGQPADSVRDGSFFRKGVVGDWRSTLTPAMSDLILQDLGWMFPAFGWTL